MSKISVIIPCYNYGKYLEETISSVLNQTFQDFEIIVIDDGSTDEFTIEILKKLEKKYPQIIFIYQKNSGVAVARNNGIKMAKGEFFLPLDADDKIDSKMLEKCLKEIEKDEKLGFVYTYTKFFGNFSGILVRPEYNFYSLLQKNYIVVSSLIRKKAWQEIGGYDENMKSGYEDWEFFIGLGKNNWLGKVIKKPLFLYREHSGFSKNKEAIEKHLQNFQIIKNKHLDIYNSKKLAEIKKEWRGRTFKNYFKPSFYLENLRITFFTFKKYGFLKFINLFKEKIKRAFLNF